MSLPEIVGFFKEDHWKDLKDDEVQFHWLYPGKELHDGLGLLHDDVSCLSMVSSIEENGVAEVYVENNAEYEILSSGLPSDVDEVDF